MKKTILAAALALLPLLSGCNTIEGFGQDMQRGGEKIEEKADENK